MLPIKASLIISIYDNTLFLKAVLNSLKFQTEKNFEIIISEDGEHPEVSQFVSSYPFEQPVQHLTQPDMGWQKNKALNRAIHASKSDWLIFIDGDCVLHPSFIENHLSLMAPKTILGGKRVKLNQSLSDMLLKEPKTVETMNRLLWAHLFWAKKEGIKFIEEGFFFNPKGPLAFLPKLRSISELKGCNMSFSKEAIIAINGFDEDFVKPAIGEDIDLTWRFKKAGYKLRSVRNMAVQYHLNHKESWTSQSENEAIMTIKKERNEFIARRGLRTLPEPKF